VKCEVIIDPRCEERVVIHARKCTPFTEKLRRMAEGEGLELIGYQDREATMLDPADVVCITVEEGKVWALRGGERYWLKERLYTLEERLPYFIKLNQSCLANPKKIERFDASISGTLRVRFKNGYTDYVSRRQLKNVRERMGI